MPASFNLLWSPSDSSILPRSTTSCSATSALGISWVFPCRSLVDSHLLCSSNPRLQYRRGRALVARLCPATPRTGVRKVRMDCSWHCLVSVPSVHATHSLGHHSHGNHRRGALLCCTTHKKHMAGHRRPQFWQSNFLSELG